MSEKQFLNKDVYDVRPALSRLEMALNTLQGGMGEQGRFGHIMFLTDGESLERDMIGELFNYLQ